MAETSPSRYRTLAVLALTAALAGCAATHVGDDWQCPLAQGEVCTSIAAADPAVAPDAAPPPLATRTPLYRTPESEAEAETETEASMKPGTEARPCAEGCNPLAWLGRLLGPRDAVAKAAENGEAVSTPDPDDVPCGSGESAPEPAAAPADADDTDAPCPIAAEAQAAATSAPTAAAAPIAPSTTAAIPCGTEDAAAASGEPPMTADGAGDVPAPENAETPCAAPASVDGTAVAEDADVKVTTAEDATTPAVIADMSPSTPAPLLPPPPAPDALRTGEVVERIWIAPFVDAGGVYREGAWVRAVLAPAGWRR